MANYIVQDTSLATVADAIRAKAGISERLEFPLGWKAAVDGIQTGGGGTAGGGDDYRKIETVVNIGAAVSVTAEGIAQPEPEVPENYTHCLYNGVRLPKIPEDVLVAYPYAWIRDNKKTGQYQLVLSATGFYMDSSNNVITDKKIVVNPQYNASGDAWVNANNTTFYIWGIDSNRTVLWSNHDIPNGSATATDIYFAGSDPVPTV